MQKGFNFGGGVEEWEEEVEDKRKMEGDEETGRVSGGFQGVSGFRGTRGRWEVGGGFRGTGLEGKVGFYSLERWESRADFP